MSITDSYLIKCAKEYAKRNPDKTIVVTHKSNVLGCKYCKDIEYLKMYVDMPKKDLNFCPYCGVNLIKD